MATTLKVIDRKSIDDLLGWIRVTSNPLIEIDCPGGDTVSAMRFIKTLKAEGLEEKLSIHITSASSAAAHIVLSLGCNRTIHPDGVITVHGGRINGELNELFLTGLWRDMQTYFRETITIIKKISTKERESTFYATNYLTLTREEIERAGIIYLERGCA